MTTVLADRMLQALKDHETGRERSQQLTLGPSELGGCREYIRNVMVGAPYQPSDEWPAAATMGTLIGDHIEALAEKYFGATTQRSITTMLPNGLLVSGTADMIFEAENMLADGKSKDGFASLDRYGASMENLIQVSIYVLGCIQNGYLREGATAVLLYVDRSGDEQTLREHVLSWEEIQRNIDLVVARVDDVLEAQEHIDQGEVEWARGLRDKTPPFCYSAKVLCPFRDLCWKGSEWVPDELITDPDTLLAVERYVAARDEEKRIADLKREARDQLLGVTGKTPDGYAVTWPGTGRALYVMKVTNHTNGSGA
jgi:hypothetical protein